MPKTVFDRPGKKRERVPNSIVDALEGPKRATTAKGRVAARYQQKLAAKRASKESK